MQLTHLYETKQRIKNMQLTLENNDVLFNTTYLLASTFVILSQYQLVSFLNFDSHSYNPLSSYYQLNDEYKFDNVIIYNTRYCTSKTFYIEMLFILNVYLLPSNDNYIAFIDYNLDKEIQLCICNIKDNVITAIAKVELIFISDLEY